MPFTLCWAPRAEAEFEQIQPAAQRALANRQQRGQSKASKQEGLFKQLVKCVDLLARNPRHPGLHTHEFHSFAHPTDPQAKVFEAYVQHRTPGAYRLFWCYGPGKGRITILAITPHP